MAKPQLRRVRALLTAPCPPLPPRAQEKVLEDDATVGDNQLQDGAVIFAVFATNDAGTAFEAVEVDDGAAPAAAEAGNA